MIPFVLCIGTLLLSGAQDEAPELIAEYLRRCQQAHAARIKVQQEQIQSLEKIVNPSALDKQRLGESQARLRQLQQQPPAPVELPLPPERNAIGLFLPASSTDLRRGKSVDLLEVIDEDEAIVRAWYYPRPLPKSSDDAGDPTFVDLWLQGVDTRDFAAGQPIQLPQVFQVIGNKVIDTTCGKRSFPLLRPIDLARYWPKR